MITKQRRLQGYDLQPLFFMPYGDCGSCRFMLY